MQTRILWIMFMCLFLCELHALALPAGDVNGDGIVDVADLVRGEKMVDGELTVDLVADVDGDLAVTATDTWLIQEAVLGRPIPTLVDSKTIGSTGGVLSDGVMSVNIAAGSSAPTYLALFRCPNEVMGESNDLHEVYMITGLSTNLAAVSVSYTLTGSNNGLCIGHKMLPYDAHKEKWYWRVLPDTHVARVGDKISVALSSHAGVSADDPASQCIKCGVAAFDTPPALPLSVLSSGVGDAGVNAAPGHKYAGYTHSGWISPLFHIYTKDWGSVSYADQERLCGYLYTIYDQLKALGFPLDTDDSSIFPQEVYVSKGIKEEGYAETSRWTGNTIIVLNANPLLSGSADELYELKATAGHEMMHRVLSLYSHGDQYAFGAMEDGITTWFERIASGNPEHLSSNYKVRTASPLKNLFQATTFWQGWKPVEQHGYAISSFVDYHFSNGNESQIYAFAQQVKSGKNVEKALDAVFTSMYGSTLYDTERQYLKFSRDYLMATNCYSSYLGSDAIFTADSDTDTKAFYKKITIRKASSNLWEKQEIDFTVQDYGCGIIQLFVMKPENIFAPHTKLKVSAPKICNSMDIIMTYKDTKNHTEIATGLYVTGPDGNKIWTCEIELPEDAKFIRLFAMTTMGNAGESASYTDTHPVAISYQFAGDFYLPPRESFISINSTKNASAGKRYYKHHELADAIFRIVDPTNIEGLTDFEPHRQTIPFTDVTMGYKMNLAYSFATASRRETGSCQIRLFSDAKVTDPDPFTIWIGGDDVFPPTPWTFDDDPVLAPDGSPQLSLLVYHYPQGTELTIGEEPYRIASTLTSVYELQQSEDGLSGGVLVDIPSQTTDYNCLIVLLSIYLDKTSSEEERWDMFSLNISPKE